MNFFHKKMNKKIEGTKASKTSVQLINNYVLPIPYGQGYGRPLEIGSLFFSNLTLNRRPDSDSTSTQINMFRLKWPTSIVQSHSLRLLLISMQERKALPSTCYKLFRNAALVRFETELLNLTVSIHGEIHEEFRKKICDSLTLPVLWIRGSISTNIAHYNQYGQQGHLGTYPIQFNKQFDLNCLPLDGLSAGAGGSTRQAEQLRQSLGVSIGLYDCQYQPQLKCNVTIEWSNVVDSPKSPIQLSSDAFIRNLFESEATKDLTIIAGNGSIVKCHKIIFAAHSSVLSAMVSPDNQMKESQTGRIEMKENSQIGLRHLLRYLYGMELETEGMTCDVAVELFETAHKYDLNHLQDSLSALLLQMDVKWYNPDHILELYFYTRNLDEFQNLRDHSLDVMTKMNTDELQKCEGFKKLDPVEAIEVLCKLVSLLQVRAASKNVSGKLAY